MQEQPKIKKSKNKCLLTQNKLKKLSYIKTDSLHFAINYTKKSIKLEKPNCTIWLLTYSSNKKPENNNKKLNKKQKIFFVAKLTNTSEIFTYKKNKDHLTCWSTLFYRLIFHHTTTIPTISIWSKTFSVNSINKI